MPRLVRLLVGIAFAAGVFLVTGELMARILNVVDRLNGYTRLLYTPGPSVDLPYLLRPGMTATLFGADVRVNGWGLRGPEIPATPPAGVERILLLGDSVAFGWGVTEEQAVGAQLAQALNAEPATGRFEVVNAGVAGFDTTAEVRLLEHNGLALAPRLVILGVSLNDYEVTPQLSPLGFLTRKELTARAPQWWERSELVAVLRWLGAYARGTLWMQLVAAPARGRAGASEAEAINRAAEAEHLRFYSAPLPVYWERTRNALLDLRRIAREQHLDLLVVVFPEGYQLRPDTDLTPQRRWLGLCDELGLQSLDLQPVFAAAEGDLFFDVQHPNARGHQLAGEAIAAALRIARAMRGGRE